MAVLFSPFGNHQFVDEDGLTANGWTLTTYAAGSTTPLTAYTTSVGNVAHSAVISIGALGFITASGAVAQLWLTEGLSYKFVLKNSAGVTKDTVDNVTGITSTASAATQWTASGLTPTYVSATSFTLAGDQTAAFHVGRRLQSTNTSGTVYSRIITSAYGALTTVTVVNDSTALDSGLSAVSYSILTATQWATPGAARPLTTRSDVASVAGAVNLTTGATSTDDIKITGTEVITSFTIAIGRVVRVTAGGAFTLTNGASIVTQTGGNIICVSGDTFVLRATAANVVEVMFFAKSSTATPVPIRQTVLSGPVTTDGLPDFGGATGGTTVTVAGTLRIAAANGFNAYGSVDYVGTLTNPSFTGLSTNGTMFGYADAVTGTVGTGTLAPIYQWGGTPSTTSGQFTFNIQEMVGYLGNGATAPQSNRVYIGEFTVSGAVVTAIVWYALMRRYRAPLTATLVGNSTQVSKSHNLGTTACRPRVFFVCTTTDNGYAVGDILWDPVTQSGSGSTSLPALTITRNAMTFSTAAGTQWLQCPKGGGNFITLTAASWSYGVTVDGEF